MSEDLKTMQHHELQNLVISLTSQLSTLRLELEKRDAAVKNAVAESIANSEHMNRQRKTIAHLQDELEKAQKERDEYKQQMEEACAGRAQWRKTALGNKTLCEALEKWASRPSLSKCPVTKSEIREALQSAKVGE